MCGTKGREFESRQGHPCLGLQMALRTGLWIYGVVNSPQVGPFTAYVFGQSVEGLL